MTTHEVTYRGPSSFAVRAAALLADSAGVELTSATRADDAGASEEEAVLVLTLEATDVELSAAVEAARAELPAGATLE